MTNDTTTCPTSKAPKNDTNISPTDQLAALVSFVNSGEIERARTLLVQLTQLDEDAISRDIPARQAAVKLYLLEERWDQAASLLARSPDLDTAGRLTLNLVRNMAMFRQCRPEQNEALHVTLTGRYQFVQAAAGAPPTIADTKTPGKALLMSAGPHPAQAAAGALQQINEPPHLGAPVGLLGIGDGYLVAALARNPPKLFMDQAQVVHVIEPDAELVQMCLMLHDFTGEDGPIQQPRFHWHVGEGWRTSLNDALANDLQLPAPVRQVRQGVVSEEMAGEIDRVLQRIAQRSDHWRQELESHYASIDLNQWRNIFSDQPARPPRVLLLTTRFSTVLQYATRDTAEGFRRNGWETRIVIEQSPCHRHFPQSVREELHDFKPDLVFQIDHQRHEQGDVVPSRLPFVCWAQDLLPNLTSRDAGAKLHERDFMLAFNTPSFIEDFGYPPRQCIDMPMMLTLAPHAPESDNQIDERAHDESIAQVEDFVYVSNVSQTPRRAAEEMLAKQVGASLRPLMRACLDEMLNCYDQGLCYSSHHDLYSLLDRHIEAQGMSLDERTYTLLSGMLWNPMNIALYRQQALRWVADLATAKGWSLGIYGRGWDTHPDFAPFARGVVEHGPALRSLTKQAKINLNLEPYACFTHHRLLDGLTADGFFLIRRHPANTLLQQLCNFLEDHLPDDVNSTKAALAAVAADQRDELERLLDGASCISLSRQDDPIRQVRCWQRAGVLRRQAEALPGIENVSFNNPQELATLAERFIGDVEGRRRIVADQRADIESRLTFSIAIRRVIGKIRERLTQ